MVEEKLRAMDRSLVEFAINTGVSAPKKQAVCRIPYAVRQEITSQLKRMQLEGVIQPSESPWASPVILVRKKDGSLQFCVDYRGLNIVKKGDMYPLPRIDDLLDKLGRAKCFSTLDIAAGYWQIRVRPDSQEKTAFITHQGLYEFKVMFWGYECSSSVSKADAESFSKIDDGTRRFCGSLFR